MKRFATLYPYAKNVHLTKDLGQIPYILHRDYGFDATLVTFPNEPDYPALQKEVAGLKLEFMEHQGKRFFLEKGVLRYLEKKAAEIDVLNLYHLSRDTVMYGLAYKKHNPGGKLYLKMDAYNHHLTKDRKWATGYVKHRIIKRAVHRFLTRVDLVSIENQKGLELFQANYKQAANKIFLLRNGVDRTMLQSLALENKSFDKKDNVILVVGRIGAPEKNH